MNRDKFVELSYMYLLDELDERNKIEFENVLMQDDALKNEFDEIKDSLDTFRASKPLPANERLLVNARQNLMREIRKRSAPAADNGKLFIKIKYYLLHNRSYALGGLATFIFGIIVCYMFLIPGSSERLIQSGDSSDLKVSNLQISKPDSINGEVEVKFDLTKHIKYKVKPEEMTTPNMLVAAMLSEPNPGIRIRSVSILEEKIKKEEFKPDNKIKEALITSLKKDKNPVVRKKALNVLNEYPFDEQIRDALLFVLSSDRNSGMRVAAINSLADYKHKGQLFDDVTRGVLNNKAVQEQSNFIRLRASSILQEMN